MDYAILSDRELDALVAEKVMGLEVNRDMWVGDYLRHRHLVDPMLWTLVPHYSTTWDGMGMVIEAMAKLGWRLRVYEMYTGPYEVTFEQAYDHGFVERTRSDVKLPRAVALAALAALEGDAK
jgi:hypothetical protein